MPTCTGPEPAWQTSSWWPAGAVFRCGCGLASYGSAYVWNDVAICAAFGDLLFATAGPQPDHMSVQQTVQPYIFYWSRANGWTDAARNISTNYCNFDMVTCGVSATNVTIDKGYGIMLGSNNLTGTVPASFSALSGLPDANMLEFGQVTNTLTLDPSILVPFATSLLYLSMAGTTLVGGTLPPLLGSLTMLRVLFAMNDALTGTLPPEIGSLTRLQALQLGGNSLTGGIPDSWSSLSALTSLSLEGNALSGTLSTTTLCGMSALTYVDLSGNSFSGNIPSLGLCTPSLQLTFLDLKSNAFTGARVVALLAIISLNALRALTRAVTLRRRQHSGRPGTGTGLHQSIIDGLANTGVSWLGRQPADGRCANIIGE